MDKKKLMKKWLRDCMPTIFSLLMTGLYSVMDGLFIGRAVGDAGLAAVNLAWPIPAVITALGIGLGTGGSILYSTALGRGERKEGEEWYLLTVKVLFGTGVFATAILYMGYPMILEVLGARGEVYCQAMRYSQIIAGGCLFQVLGAGMVPILRNRGEAMGAMVSMSMGMLVNLGLNYVLIFVVGMGIREAAVGTVSAQIVVVAFGCVLIWRQGKRKKGWKERIIREECSLEGKKATGETTVFMRGNIGGKMAKIAKAGLSAFGLSLAPSVVLIFTNYRCLQYGGDAVVACYAVISYLTFPAQYVLTGIGDGSQPLMSYYNGCGRMEELEFIQKMAKRFAAGIGFFLIIIVWVILPWIPGVFGMSDEARQYFAEGMRISSLAFLCLGMARFHIAYMSAVLRTREASALIYGETLAVSPVLLVILPKLLGRVGIWWTLPIGQVIMLLIYGLCFSEKKAE